MGTINDMPFSGYPAGAVRLVKVKSKRPVWWRRLWNWMNGRPTPWNVTYEFAANPGGVGA
jgi:hypothetical protein